MITIDLRTVIFSNLVIFCIFFIIMLELWYQNHTRYRGLGYWLFYSVCQVAGSFLLAMRGMIPNWASVVLGNVMIVGGLYILFFGLRIFVGNKKNSLLTYSLIVYFCIYVLIHSYFTFVQDILMVRLYNTAIAMSLVSYLGARLMIREVDLDARSIYRGIGISFTLYGLVNVIRIADFYLWPITNTNADLMRISGLSTLLVLLLVGSGALIAFHLVLIINRRLYAEAKKLEQNHEDIIVQLQNALSHVKKLSGMLPICSSCKKIRDDKGYWNQIESYVRDHSEAQFSHGICPECAKKLYPDLYNKLFDKTIDE